MTKFNLKGWHVGSWFVGNWSTIKEIFKIGVPYLVGSALFADNVPAQIVVTAVGKLVLDLGHYFIKE